MQPANNHYKETESPEEYSTRISNVIKEAETAEEAYREIIKCIEENLLFEKRHLELFLSRFLPSRRERNADNLNSSPDDEQEKIQVADARWEQIISLVSELYTCSQTRHRFSTGQLIQARDEFSHHPGEPERTANGTSQSVKKG